MNTEKGFTLIEVLIVLTIITMLAAVVIIAINPARQFAQARNTQRWAAVNSILNATHQNMVDNDGNFDFSGCGATEIPTTSAQVIASTGTNAVDLCACLVPTYVAELPVDPSTGYYNSCSDYDTGYEILQSGTTTGRITISAPDAELNETIQVSR